MESFYRCGHCRGFYETALAACKWCDYDAPVHDASGQPRVFANRETIRAVRLAEYEQLPAEAHDDPMRPPPENPALLCGCLHCGPDGHEFEAIEMRWIANERMWACPCTTCGGRGFMVDVHPVGRVWQCASCSHWYTPEKMTSKYAKCPRCGSTDANGWFDDEDDDGEPIAEGDETWDEEADETLADGPDEAVAGEPSRDDPPPWDDDVEPYDPLQGQAEESSARERLPDDIDFPRERGEEPPPAGESDVRF
jgi:hypothetical protein